MRAQLTMSDCRHPQRGGWEKTLPGNFSAETVPINRALHARTRTAATGRCVKGGRFYPPECTASRRKVVHAAHPFRQAGHSAVRAGLYLTGWLILATTLFVLASDRGSSPLPIRIDLASARLLVVARQTCTGCRRGIRLRANGGQVLLIAVQGRCALQPDRFLLRVVTLLPRPGFPFGMLLRRRRFFGCGAGCHGDLAKCCHSDAEDDGLKPDRHVTFFR